MKQARNNSKTLCRIRGLAEDLIVTRKGAVITLWSSAGIRHTVFDMNAPHLPGLEYARNMLAALAFCPKARSCLVLGLGGGSVPRMLLKASPHMEVEAVEIDPAIVELAEKYFDIHALPRCRIRLQDAVAFLGRCTSRYAIVMVDTYLGEQFPDQCATREFIMDARKCLLDDGVLAVNWLSGDRRKRDTLLKMIEGSVGPVWQLPGLKSDNILYFASAGRATRPAILSAAVDVQTQIPFENSLARLVRRLEMVSALETRSI
ncbi:MAG: fused MFS/spermidine synthase [Acidobacteria bacterium]|nr:fused MFS/spermidine synthase [Acidobacteriota bacterium]